MEFLCARNITGAVDSAVQQGMFRLASVLSQLGSDSSMPYLFIHQLNQWSNNSTWELLDDRIREVYCILASVPSFGGFNPLTRVNWARSLAMIFWYFIDNGSFLSLVDAVRYYLSLMSNDVQVVEAPKSPYDEALFHGIFYLLQALVMDVPYRNALHSHGYGADLLDCRISYVVMCLFESIGVMAQRDNLSCLIRLQFISQLLAEGSFKWALFVAMQCPCQEKARSDLVQSILNQWVGACAPDFDEISKTVAVLKCPVNHLEIALATWFHWMGDYKMEFQHWMNAGRSDDAIDVLCFHLAPSYLFFEEKFIESCVQQLGRARGRDINPCSLYSIIVGYLKFKSDAVKPSVEDCRGLTFIEDFTGLGTNVLETICAVHENLRYHPNAEIVQAMLMNIASYIWDVLANISGSHYLLGTAALSMMGRNSTLVCCDTKQSLVSRSIAEYLNGATDELM